MTLAIGEDKEHAEYSASGSQRWLSCPASHALSKKAPPQLESPWAKEGTEAHACLEFFLKNTTRDHRALVKTALKTWNKEMVGHACDAADWLVKRRNELTGSQLISERKVDSSAFTCTGQFGTLDAAVIQPFGKLVVADYKYGAGYAVDPDGDDGAGNSQLVYYALAVSYAYDHNFESIDLVVIQPRAFHSSGNTVRVFTLAMDELLKWHQRFRDGVMETNNPKAAFNSGSWCKFCPAKPLCPEISKNALATAKASFSDVSGEVVLPEVATIPNLGNVLKACDKLEDWIAGVREHAFHVLSKGKSVPGYKLVDKRATRKWVDAAKTEAEARKAFGAKAFSSPELLSPAQLEKLGDKAKAFVGARVVSESSGKTLAPEEDKRKEVKPLKEIFGELPIAKGRKAK